MGLSSNISLTYMDAGLKNAHPVLAIHDFVTALSQQQKMDTILMGNRAKDFRAFWAKWKLLQPNHPVFQCDLAKLDWSIPVAVHCDEGTSQKKKALMVIQYQSLLGEGTRKRKRSDMEPGVNYLGSSVRTRYLYSVMLGRLYSSKKNQNGPLLKVMDRMGVELSSAMERGFSVMIDGVPQRIFLVPLGMKGDWPAISKVASLTRHHGRDTPTRYDGNGICHLCLGGQAGHSWHDLRQANMEKMRRGAPLPWKKEPGLISPLELPNAYKPAFFRIDLFHSCQKDVMADIGANTLAPCPSPATFCEIYWGT